MKLRTEGPTRDEVTAARAAEMAYEAAKSRPEAFVDLIMRDERTQSPIIVQPHQMVGLAHLWDHSRSVQLWPVNHAKTFGVAALALLQIGQNPKSRGAIISATQQQASKLVSVVGDYILQSESYRYLFGVEPGKVWTQTNLEVKRPGNIKDPTLAAYGMDSKGIVGSRLDWIYVDDLLNFENTRTKDQRDKVAEWFDSSLISRIEGHSEGRIGVTNSAWNQDDQCHRLLKQGWAGLRMQVDGGIYVKDDIENIQKGMAWDHDLLVPAPERGDTSLGEKCVLKGWQPGEMLWKNHPTIKSEASLRIKHPISSEFNRLYMSLCRDDDTAYCKAEWIEKCKRQAFGRGFRELTHHRKGGNTYTGVDLAVSPGEESDDVAIFTFEVLPDGGRLVLDLDIGKFDGPMIVRKLIDVHDRYDSVIRVENNASQEFLIQFLRQAGRHIPVKSHTTGRNKAHPEHGVMSMFTEFAQGLWLIPSDSAGNVHPNVQRWLDECLYYAPSKHTGDALMASWIAREQARQWGMLKEGATNNRGEASISMGIMMR